MSSSKSTPKAAGGWGSLFSNAVANLESRLDVILADDAEASARERAAEKAKKDIEHRGRANSGSLNVATPKSLAQHGRDGSNPRNNDRLAERLAKATAVKSASQTATANPSRVPTPVLEPGKNRKSIEAIEATSSSDHANVLDVQMPSTTNSGTTVSNDTVTKTLLLESGLSINPGRLSTDSPRYSLEMQSDVPSSRPSSDLSKVMAQENDNQSDTPAHIHEDSEAIREREKQRQEEMHTYMERIDALQAKLQYLAEESVAAARKANASASPGSQAARLAEKDEKIALLMQEGEKLSKVEMRHLQTIKKLRTAAVEEEKTGRELRKKNEQLTRLESDLKHKLQRSEAAQRQAEEKSNQIQTISQQVDELTADREAAAELIRTLTVQLKEAKERTELAGKSILSKPSESDKNKIASLENELEDALIEKRLANDRATVEKNKLRDELVQLRQASELRELETKNEIAGLESRLETLRTRAEEATTDGGSDVVNIKLIRQVETLQGQYNQAKENWETIENALNSRLSALEHERDETAKREADLRKKYREVSARCRKVENELETSVENSRSITQKLKSTQDELVSLQKAHHDSTIELAESKAQLEYQRKTVDQTIQQRLEEERSRWVASPPLQGLPTFRAMDSPTSSRKNSTMTDTMNGGYTNRRNIHRNVTQDPSLEASRMPNRRGSAMPIPTLRSPQPVTISREESPALSRQTSQVALDVTPGSIPATPSTEIDQDFESASPQRTINDLVSTSTAGAGPSVQLVERLSLAVRRLESEKAAFKDELTRLASQRDDARGEIVSLMRELDSKKLQEQRLVDADDLRKRYEASLEMLGEREEEVQELKQDMTELKQMYKDLIEDKVGPGAI